MKFSKTIGNIKKYLFEFDLWDFDWWIYTLFPITTLVGISLFLFDNGWGLTKWFTFIGYQFGLYGFSLIITNIFSIVKSSQKVVGSSIVLVIMGFAFVIFGISSDFEKWYFAGIYLILSFVLAYISLVVYSRNPHNTIPGDYKDTEEELKKNINKTKVNNKYGSVGEENA